MSRILANITACLLAVAAPARAEELWIAPTYQQDIGGLGVASNAFWPVTAAGVVRLAWPIPADLQTFQKAGVVVVPGGAGGPSTLNVFVCQAQDGGSVGSGCAGPFTQNFTSVTNQLVEVEIGGLIASHIGTPGAGYLAVLAYTTPATTTDHIVGLRFSYAPAVPAGVATLTGNTFTGPQTIDAGNLDIDASTATMGNVTKNGTLFLHNFGLGNTFLGLSAGNSTLFGSLNVGVGDAALTALRSGSDNSAVGWNALSHNTTGGSNTALGMQSLWMSTSGNQNTAAGWQALQFNTGGDFNTAVGAGALRTATANQNTAVGNLALISITTGGRNVAIGSHAGEYSSTGFDNIYIGTNVIGAEGETKTIYLGAQGTQTHTFIAGIRGITTGVGNAVPVVIDSNGQLGTVSSSIRFKEDVHDMGGTSQRLFGLRPVTFRYRKAYANDARPMQFGLVAEEVADVFPELAVRNADGEVETVHYETLSVLLLNELQRQEKRIDALEQAMRVILAREQ